VRRVPARRTVPPRHRRRKQEREDDRRIARLEALMAVQMVDDEEGDDGA
jgi:hypothetical protein